ncbi:TetR/AcrR family transcriptional regulator [Microbacterium murale]|uniref:Transcriptional regulator n=1 Tax=Microbacterium murale TaxID=1081040 RepID=A0ABQ1S2H5_9MICO|nr:TetR family transcriptional regulator C-terminal domain-containing protein [Microbacterium murale]GGD88401.1 transcriptional regulator [Microbacterium murale]
MPKIVDHAARRTELAHAFWNVTLRDGIAAASVRGVATEANCSPAALRYYFPSQDELLDFTWTFVLGRALARAEALDLPDSPLEAAQVQLEQSLPLDGERLAEARLWFTVASSAGSNERLQARVRELHTLLNRGCTEVIHRLREAGVVDPARDASTEAVRLHAFLDGVAFHMAMRAESYSAAQIRAMLRRHLEDLACP